MKPRIKLINQWGWSRRDVGHINLIGIHAAWTRFDWAQEVGLGFIVFGFGIYLGLGSVKDKT